MSTYVDYLNRDALQHHGIKGQKHGVRNGPPYPLNPADHSAREKRGERSPNSSLADNENKSRRAKKASKKDSKEMASLKSRKPKNPHAFTKHFLRSMGNSLVTGIASEALTQTGHKKADEWLRASSNTISNVSSLYMWKEAWDYHKEKRAWKKEYKALKKKEKAKS